MDASRSGWTEGTYKSFISFKKHLKEFEKMAGEITLNRFNEDFWNNFRDNYFVNLKKLSNNSSNIMLKKLKQFLMFADKKHFLKQRINFDELILLEEIEPFKISLKEVEVKKLMNLDLSSTPRLD